MSQKEPPEVLRWRQRLSNRDKGLAVLAAAVELAGLRPLPDIENKALSRHSNSLMNWPGT